MSSAFCVTTVLRGEPLSYVYDGYSSQTGFPTVARFTGTDYCGIALQTVVDIDATRNALSSTEVMVGGLIHCLKHGGTVRIPKVLLSSMYTEEQYLFNQYVQPCVEHMWKITKDRTLDSVGWIRNDYEHYIEVVLL